MDSFCFRMCSDGVIQAYASYGKCEMGDDMKNISFGKDEGFMRALLHFKRILYNFFHQ